MFVSVRADQKERIDTMNNNEQFYRDDLASVEDRLSIHPDSQPSTDASPSPKHVLTPKQFRDHVACLTDVSSTTGKIIDRQTRLREVMEFVLRECTRKSLGGLQEFGLNQAELRTKKLPSSKKLIQKQTLTDCIKNLLEHGLIVKVENYSVGRKSNQYVIGQKIKEILHSPKGGNDDKDKTINNCSTENRLKFLNFGYNPEDKHECPMCNKTLFVTKFGINDGRLLPMCSACNRVERAKPTPEGKQLWANWYNEK